MKSMKLMLPALLLTFGLGAFAQDDDELLEATSEDEAIESLVPKNPYEKPIFHRLQLGFVGTSAKYTNNSLQKSPTAPRKETYFLPGVSLGGMGDLRLMTTQPFYIEVGTTFAYQTGNSKEDSIYSYHVGMPKGEYTIRNYRVHAFSLTIPINLTWQFRNIKGIEGFTLAPFAGVYGRFNLVANRKETATTTLYDDNGNALPTTVTTISKSLRTDNNNGRNGWMEGRNHIGKLFQVGAQVGLNAFYKHYSFGVAYMCDITPFASASSPAGTTKVPKSVGGYTVTSGTGSDMYISTRHNFAVTVGYIF